MKTKKKTVTKKKTATNIRIVERVVGLRPDYRTPTDVEDAIWSYAGCYSGYPVHRIISYVRRLENLLRGNPSPGNCVLYPRCCVARRDSKQARLEAIRAAWRSLHSPCAGHS